MAQKLYIKIQPRRMDFKYRQIPLQVKQVHIPLWASERHITLKQQDWVGSENP